MKRIMFIISLLSIIFISCSNSEKNKQKFSVNSDLNKQLPKVLFITTGVNFEKEDKDLPKGIIIAIQTFNKKGIPVRLEPRDVLFDYGFLSQYSIIILSTAKDYHDGDRKYSLTYMTNEELNNLKNYVKNGGTLIAGDNIGRNYFNGTDRILEKQELNPENYPLSEVFGVILKEINMQGYKVNGKINNELQGEFLPQVDYNLWTLAPYQIVSNKIKTLAMWKKDTDSIPAIIKNTYEKGTAYLLASSDFINPIVSGGYWSVSQIEAFYNYVSEQFIKEKEIAISINPWPNAHNSAFCVSFNPTGEIEHYKFVISRLKKINIKPTFFVNGQVNDKINDFLQSQNVNIASTGYGYLNFNEINFAASINDILRNEAKWQQKFSGFRFPYTNPGFAGLMAMDIKAYKYESSISANNFEFIHGSVFPYNLVISKDDFYKSTNILEIAPTYHDDYFFLYKIAENEYKTPENLQKDVLLYSRYLQDYWQYSVKPYNGLMVYLGHPGLSGYNETTFSALTTLIDTIKNDNAWITTLEDVADFRNKFEKINVLFEQNKDSYTIKIKAPKGISIEKFTINLKEKPDKVKAMKGEVLVKGNNVGYSIIFDAFDGQFVTIREEKKE